MMENGKHPRTPLTWLVDVGVEEQHYPTHALYIVGLPIGNVADISLRSWWVLRSVDAIAAEDTRNTRQLLDRLGIDKPLIAVHEHNEREMAEKLRARLQAGERIALVTDAGTPAISDPGAKVVLEIQAAGLKVIPIPGASAVVTAMSASGCLGTGFTFVGFVSSQKKARETELKAWLNQRTPVVFYEAPHRVLDFLTSLAGLMESARRVVIHRELTKRFETIEALTGETLSAFVQGHKPQGEYVIVVDVAPEAGVTIDEQTLKWLDLLKDALPASKAAQLAAKATGLPRQMLYHYFTEGSWPSTEAAPQENWPF